MSFIYRLPDKSQSLQAEIFIPRNTDKQILSPKSLNVWKSISIARTEPQMANKNQKKANLLDHHSIKHILDESVSEVTHKKP